VRLPREAVGVDVNDLLWSGIQAGIEEGNAEEAKKRGMMRGASQGLFLDPETIVGPCHRAALARMLGGNAPKPADWTQKQLMFDSGHANEDSWVANLKRSWKGRILREEEFPIEWRITTPEGQEYVGSGREDIILCWPDGEGPKDAPKVKLPDGTEVRVAQFVELKQISSINTAVDVLFAGGKPKLEHGIQVARYTLQYRVPAQIWYTLPFVLPVPNWSFLTPKIPKQGEPYSERVDYSPKTGEATKIQPSAVGYHFAWFGDRLHYMRVGEEASELWVPTIITAEGLDDFWRMTIDMEIVGDLGPRPKQVDIVGNPERWGNKTRCDYCDWKPICDAHEADFGAWKAAVEDTIPEVPVQGDQKKGK
jgi:hypothetical protein